MGTSQDILTSKIILDRSYIVHGRSGFIKNTFVKFTISVQKIKLECTVAVEKSGLKTRILSFLLVNICIECPVQCCLVNFLCFCSIAFSFFYVFFICIYWCKFCLETDLFDNQPISGWSVHLISLDVFIIHSFVHIRFVLSTICVDFVSQFHFSFCISPQNQKAIGQLVFENILSISVNCINCEWKNQKIIS